MPPTIPGCLEQVSSSFSVATPGIPDDQSPSSKRPRTSQIHRWVLHQRPSAPVPNINQTSENTLENLAALILDMGSIFNESALCQRYLQTCLELFISWECSNISKLPTVIHFMLRFSRFQTTMRPQWTS